MIESVGWNWQNASETTTGSILIGTTKGRRQFASWFVEGCNGPRTGLEVHALLWIPTQCVQCRF